MRGTAPPPIVPEMSTTGQPRTEREPEVTSDGGEPRTEREPSSGHGSDGGERRGLPERTFGAPLVPDCS